MNGGESSARDAGDELDEPPPGGLVWSLRQEHEAQVVKWDGFPVWAAQNYLPVEAAIAAAIAAAGAAAAAARAAEEAYQALPKCVLDLVGPLAVSAETMAQGHHDLQRIGECLGSVPVDFYPPNWWPVTQLDSGAAMAIMRAEGIPLAWVPRVEIVTDLISAPDTAARDTILVTRTPEIVEDCRQRLAEVLDADLRDLNRLTGNVLRALEQSNPSAAQALAANVFDTFLRDMRHRGRLFAGPSGRFKYQHVTRGITPASDETLISLYRATCVLTPVLKALADFNFDTDPVPGRFTRHATAHRAGTTQYALTNAVIATMLTTSLLREAQESGW